MVAKSAQYKIQQMAFMILAIFFFFILVGLFFIGWQVVNIQQSHARLQEEKALSALKVIADSSEFNCDANQDWCIDKDKLTAFTHYADLYSDFWSVASIELLIVYPPRIEKDSTNYEPILCPDVGCDYYKLYDSGQRNRRIYSAYVSVCEDIDRSHTICELGKLMLGVVVHE